MFETVASRKLQRDYCLRSCPGEIARTFWRAIRKGVPIILGQFSLCSTYVPIPTELLVKILFHSNSLVANHKLNTILFKISNFRWQTNWNLLVYHSISNKICQCFLNRNNMFRRFVTIFLKYFFCWLNMLSLRFVHKRFQLKVFVIVSEILLQEQLLLGFDYSCKNLYISFQMRLIGTMDTICLK